MGNRGGGGQKLLSTYCILGSDICYIWPCSRSSIGTVVFTVLIDSLLRRLRHFTFAFADDVKFSADVAKSSQVELQIA